MGNDADRYRRYLDGDDNGIIEIIDIYHEGLTLYLNSIVDNICVAEELIDCSQHHRNEHRPPCGNAFALLAVCAEF